MDRSADLELPNCQAKLRVKRSGMTKCFERRRDSEIQEKLITYKDDDIWYA